MGNCCTTTPEARTQTTTTPRKDTGKEAENKQLEIKKLNEVAEKWKDDSRKIWQRPIDDLPVHLDLPRLGRKIRIYRDSQVIFDKATTKTNSENQRDIVFQFLKVLADTVSETTKAEDSEKILALIEEKYYQFIKPDGDVSQQLLSFLKDALPPQSPFVQVLKLCHQKMVFPAYYYLKSFIFEKESFKDKRGSWHVALHFLESEKQIRVEHYKSQQSKVLLSDNKAEFEFSWRLVFIMDLSCEQIKEVDAKILTVNINPLADEKRKNEIKKVFDRPEIMASASDQIDQSQNILDDEEE